MAISALKPISIKFNKIRGSKLNQAIRKIIIIGGTSGIGLALAQAHLADGWQVCVVGHSSHKIKAINQLYPQIQTFYCDLTNRRERNELFKQLKANELEAKQLKTGQLENDQPQSKQLPFKQVSSRSSKQFSRLIYCAGWYINERVSTLDQHNSDQMLAINLQAFQETFSWASEQLKTYKAVHQQPAELITIASIAGLLDYPYSSLYAQSKRAMMSTASAYRTALAPYDIDVITIAPGYINTAMLRSLNDGDASHKPFIISEEQAIEHILKAITDKTALSVFPSKMKFLVKGLSLLPKPMLGWLMLKNLDKK